MIINTARASRTADISLQEKSTIDNNITKTEEARLRSMAGMIVV